MSRSPTLVRAQHSVDPTTPDILQRLRHETHAEHALIEASLGLMEPGLSLARYQHCLSRFYGFYRPIETLLAKCFERPSWGIHMPSRCKTGLLARDLERFGMTDLNSIPLCTALPILATPAAGFGCLYVLEGATLGGQIISGHAAHRFGFNAEHGATFFHGYGSQTGAMWREFRRSLSSFVEESPVDDDVVMAAIATFRALRQWCNQESAA